MVLLAQGMDAARIAEVTFIGADRVIDIIHNVNADGFDGARSRTRSAYSTLRRHGDRGAAGHGR
jgi:hypothetical protein